MSKTPTDWQPMETAPRDGSWILLCNQVDCLAVSGYWDVRDDDWMTDVNLPYFIPAYWLPLPAAPSQGKTAMTNHSGDANKKGDAMSEIRATKSADTLAVEAYLQQSQRRDRYIAALSAMRGALIDPLAPPQWLHDAAVELLDALLDVETEGGTR
jgi:hypothetical protein